jgi:hypothetical protein
MATHDVLLTVDSEVGSICLGSVELSNTNPYVQQLVPSSHNAAFKISTLMSYTVL